MKFNDCFKYPRLYVCDDLAENTGLVLDTDQMHYLKNVLRKQPGDHVRIFNTRDGEWIATIETLGKKEGTLKTTEQFKPQPKDETPLNLLFAPIKKKNMDFLIEKAVELGVTDLTPVITTRTQNNKINEERMQVRMTEASEQCERLTIPNFHKPQTLEQLLQNWEAETTIHWCAERLDNTKMLSECAEAAAFLIGPEGGFDDSETAKLQSTPFIQPIDLGEQILRAETAGIFCLSYAKATRLK